MITADDLCWPVTTPSQPGDSHMGDNTDSMVDEGKELLCPNLGAPRRCSGRGEAQTSYDERLQRLFSEWPPQELLDVKSGAGHALPPVTRVPWPGSTSVDNEGEPDAAHAPRESAVPCTLQAEAAPELADRAAAIPVERAAHPPADPDLATPSAAVDMGGGSRRRRSMPPAGLPASGAPHVAGDAERPSSKRVRFTSAVGASATVVEHPFQAQTRARAKRTAMAVDPEHAFLDASIAQVKSELPIFKKRLEEEERINKAPKRKRSVGTTSTADASVSKSDELLDCVVCDDDKRDPQTSTSGSTLTDTDRMPARKRNVCAQSGCSTFARRQSAGSTCYAHGSGGKRCKVPDCGKCAQSGTDACVAHGGGKHCEEPDCLKSAVGGTGACVAHGPRCEYELYNCPNGQSRSGAARTMCIRHGGGLTAEELRDRDEQRARQEVLKAQQREVMARGYRAPTPEEKA